MFCPKCKAEYRESFTSCPQCNCSLVNELPTEPQTSHESEKYVLLIECTSDNEAFYLVPLLESYGIPTHKVYTGSSEFLKFYMGGVAFGLDILVPESRLEEARGLLHAKIDWDEVNGDDAQ